MGELGLPANMAWRRQELSSPGQCVTPWRATKGRRIPGGESSCLVLELCWQRVGRAAHVEHRWFCVVSSLSVEQERHWTQGQLMLNFLFFFGKLPGHLAHCPRDTGGNIGAILGSLTNLSLGFHWLYSSYLFYFSNTISLTTVLWDPCIPSHGYFFLQMDQKPIFCLF